MAEVNSKIVKGLTEFSWNLYRLAAQNGDNFLISPHSVCSALMLTCLGAKGNTADQIFKALGMRGMTFEGYHMAFSVLNDALKNDGSDGVKLNVANKLFAGSTMKVLEKYVLDASELYASGTETMDFAAKPDESRQLINKWVEDQTNSKIKDFLNEKSITFRTRFVLANAVYFKGKWFEPFKPEKTVSNTFWLSSASSTEVKMMRQKYDMQYTRNKKLKFSAVSVPYQNNAVSMVIVRPDDVDGLSKIESSIKQENVGSLLVDLRHSMKANVDLGLPKFTFKQTSDLKHILPKLGVTDLFDESKADLSAMTDASGIAINNAIHEAFIDVNEEGTEATAATAMISILWEIPKVEFICDRPFLFMLVQNMSDHILFIGRFAKP